MMHPSITWLEIVHTLVSLVVAASLIVACFLLSRSNQQLQAVHAQLEMRNEQGQEAVSLLRAVVASRTEP
jgi:Flp pilus assembly protein protease CpaA